MENAFDTPEHLLGFSLIDPQVMCSDIIASERFGEQKFNSSSLISHGKKSVKPVVNATSLEVQYEIFKKIAATKRLKYESNQSSSLAETNKNILMENEK